jgi:hypothetical protein
LSVLLEADVPDPDIFPPEMLDKHPFKHQFLLPLLGGSKIEEYNIPIIVKAQTISTRQNQMAGFLGKIPVAWDLM